MFDDSEPAASTSKCDGVRRQACDFQAELSDFDAQRLDRRHRAGQLGFHLVTRLGDGCGFTPLQLGDLSLGVNRE